MRFGLFHEDSGRSVKDLKWQSERILFIFYQEDRSGQCGVWPAGQPAQGRKVDVGIRGATLRL